ncbi:MAG TPA: HEAT repeat domain-containing protein, partial [bacterium]|nr:HEAT repeat domain-containing protein [bacterium]
LKKNSDGFVVNRFLRELSSRLLRSQGSSAGLELLETAASLWEKLLLFGSVKGAVLFIKTLKMIAEKLESDQPEYSKKIREGFSSLDDTEFISDVFATLEDLPSDELEAIGELFQMVPSSRIEFLVAKINDLESTSTRIGVIESFSKFIVITEELLSLTKHEDWKVVRNALALMKDKKDHRIVPAIRNAISHPQKQARIEALALLMEFSIEEAMPALEKAVFSSEREIRAIAIRKVLELKEAKVKAIVNRALQVNNLKKLDKDEADEYLKLLIDMRRGDLYDLIGNLLFSEDAEMKGKAVLAIFNAPTLSPFSKFIAKASDMSILSKMKSDEIKNFCRLYKPETYKELLPKLESFFNVSGTIFNKTVTGIKEIIFKSLVIYVDDPSVVAFFRKGMSSGNKETVSLIEKIAAKYL